MKIAVTYENGQVFQHFGHTEAFKVYETENNEIKSESIIPTLGSGHGALAGFLKLNNVDTLICGGIGQVRALHWRRPGSDSIQVRRAVRTRQ